MTNRHRTRRGSSYASVLVRVALRLYPPAWRARYDDEVGALVDDSGADLRTAASFAWHAIPAWIWPAPHLYDRPARMRTSLSTVLVAWAVLTGIGLVFLQLTQAQNVAPPGHPLVQWSYWVFDAALAVSVLAVAAGGLPLWLVMLRTARRERSRLNVAYLLSPVAVPMAYLAVLIAIARLVRHDRGGKVYPKLNSVIDLANGGVGPWWFLALTALGIVAGVLSAAGPGLALRQIRPHGPVIGRATKMAGVAVAAMSLAGASSVAAAVGLYLWAPQYAGYHQTWPLGIYLPTVFLVTAVAIVSATRGIRAARSQVTA